MICNNFSDFLIQLWKLPCFAAELYLNYDCDLFCSNIFEDTTKLLSKNAFPIQTGLNSTHLLCLDGLVSILDGIEAHCTHRITTNPNSSSSSGGSDESNSSVFYHDDGTPDRNFFSGKENLGSDANPTMLPRSRSLNTSASSAPELSLPTHEQLMAIRHKKKVNRKMSNTAHLTSVKSFLKQFTDIRHWLRAIQQPCFEGYSVSPDSWDFEGSSRPERSCGISSGESFTRQACDWGFYFKSEEY